MEKKLKKCDTFPGIVSTIEKLLCQDQEEVIRNMHTPCSYTEVLLMQAATKQHALGSHALPKGFVSEGWAIVQKEWCYTRKLCFNSDRWVMTLIKAIQNFTQAMWTKRNVRLHGETESEQREIIKMKCKKRIRELYKRPRHRLTLQNKKLFQMPLVY